MRICTGIAIEGVGFDTSKTDGLFIYYGLNGLNVASNREGRSALVALPQGTSTRINPYTGDISTNSLSFEISASDAMARMLMSIQRRTRSSIQSDIDALATTIAIGTSGLDNTPVWVGDETILLGTDTGGGVYESCVRGFWGSPTQAHSTKAGVFTRVPGWKNRMITVIEHNPDTGSEVVVGRYHIDNIEMDGPRILISTNELFSSWRGAQVNVGPADLTRLGASVFITPRGDIAGAYIGYTPQVLATPGTRTYVEINEQGVTSFASSNRVLRGAYRSHWLFDAPIVPSSEEQITSAYEVFVISRRSGSGSTVEGDFTTESLTYPAHPLAIALALITSTGNGYNGAYDILGRLWGLGLDYISWASWEAEIAATPDMCIDELVLGRGGEMVNVFAVIQNQLLRPFGYFLSITNEGLLTIERLRLPTLIDWQNAQSSGVNAYIDGPLRVDQAMNDIADTITASVGGAGSGNSTGVTVRTPERSQRTERLGDIREHDLNYTAISPDRLGVVDESSLGDLSNALVNLLQLSLDAVPRLFVRVGNPAATGEGDYNHGRIIRINDLAGLQSAWIVNADGVRVDDLDDIDFAGMIIGREYDLKRRTYTLELLFLSYHVRKFIRLRAPSGVVDTVSGAENTIRLKTAVFSDADAAAFNPNDEIELWTPDGKRWSDSQVRTINNVSGDDLVLDGWFASDPPENTIVRLASSSNYSNNTIYGLTQRPYVYLADANGQIDENGTLVDADIYGTNIYGGAFDTDEGLGRRFVGVDDEAFDTTSGDCPPLDTWLEHRLRSNAQHLIEQGNQVSWSPLSGHSNDLDASSGIRGYGSMSRSTVLCVPWLMERGLSQIDMHMVARVAREGIGANFYEATLELRSINVPSKSITMLVNTQSSTPEFQNVTLQLELARPVTTREIAPLMLWGRSQDAGFVDEVANGGQKQGPIMVSDNLFYRDTSGARPSATSFDHQYSQMSDGTNHDHIKTLSIASASSDEAMYLYPPPPNTAPLTRRHMTYMQLRGLEVQTSYVDNTAPAKSVLKGGLPVLGEVEGMHAIRTNAVYRRARPLWIGPRGQVPSSESGWPSGYVTRFARMSGDESNKALLRCNLFPSTDNPTLLVLAYVLPVLNNNKPLVGGVRRVGVEDPDIVRGDWRVWAVVDELQMGQTWSGATELGSSEVVSANTELIHVPFDVSGNVPALLQEYIMNTYTNEAFAMKEGQLYAPDLEYLTLIQAQVPITRDASGELPCRLRLFVDFDTTTDSPFNTVDGLYGPEDALLTVVGASVWEIPQ